ncbi:hypothetical protein [Mucilaginibacter sp.]|uniref:hypothetical protein n=1 Tax=Mucilaginibacter sp. TaxID=1882438 RepID=UPI00262B7EAE|nr:hypothetical protein [Mucilaginibacter sp.]MDB4925387.1 hypothetical protein [Mucilaginibacter sp.]
MKKIVIITGIVLTTGLTAFSLTRKENKTEEVKVKVENLDNKATTQSANVILATAD